MATNEVDAFAGKLDYARYGFFDKLMIKLIMLLTKGAIYSNQPIEFTDWNRVQAFTKQVISHINVDTSLEQITPEQAKSEQTLENTVANSVSADARHARENEHESASENQSKEHFASQITAQSTPTDNLLIVCGHCSTTNRIPSAKLADNPICGQCKQPIMSEQPITLDSNISKHTQTNQVLTIVDFWASWCQPCQQMAPQFANASKQLPQVVFAKLQTDKYEHASTPYLIRSLPTLVAFKNGVEISRQSGVMSVGQIVQWVKSLDETIKVK